MWPVRGLSSVFDARGMYSYLPQYGSAKKEGDEGEEDDVGLDPSATWLPGRPLQPEEFSKERRLL